MATIKHGRTAAITIEIYTPELEALILQRMRSGGFRAVEEALLQASKTPMPMPEQTGKTAATRTGANLIAALQASPYREVDIQPARYRVPVRDVARKGRGCSTPTSFRKYENPSRNRRCLRLVRGSRLSSYISAR